MKKSLTLFTFLILLTLHTPASSSEKRILTLWEFSANEELLRNLLKEFEATHPNVVVKVQQLSWEHGLEKIIISLATGNAPDVVELGTDWVSKFTSSGLLRDLTEETKDFREAYFLWESVTHNGRVYGVPWLAGTRLLFYNRDLFKQGGLDPDDPPQTWEELLGAAKKIHDPKRGIYGFSIFVGEPYSPWQEFLPFAWGNGAVLLSLDEKRCLIDEAPMVEALAFYQRLKPYALMDRQSQVNTLFANGKVGMQISGAWNFRLIPRLNPALDFGVSLLPKPAADRGIPAAFAGGEIFAILKHSPRPKEAMALIRFLIEEENTLEVIQFQQNVIPTLKKSLEHPYFRKNPQQRLFAEQMKTAVAPPLHPRWVDIQEIITRSIEEVMIQGSPPQQSLTDAKKRIESLLQEEKKRHPFPTQGVAFLLSLAALLSLGIFLRKRKRASPAPPQRRLQENLVILFFLSPWLLTFFIFGLYPLLYSFVLSFSQYDLLSGDAQFIGLDNYLKLFGDAEFRSALWRTLFFAAGTVPCIVGLALLTAMLLHRALPLKTVYQTAFLLPVSTSAIVIATLFTYLYSPEGTLNHLLERLGLPRPDPAWLVHPRWALPSIMGMSVWMNFGYSMILILAGLQTIPRSLLESALIDGASEWQRFRHIFLPHLRHVLLFVVVMNTIYALQLFPEILTMTQGGPLGTTRTVVFHLYETGFRKFNLGLAAAIGYSLSVVTLFFSFIQMRLFKMGGSVKE